MAPAGLATRRQLSACGLRPGGARPVAGLSWRRGERWADLYSLAAAKPKRPMTPAKAEALAKAMRARRTCPTCARDAGYVIPTSLGCCLDCHENPTGAALPAAA
ncbi:RRQRL motif-containing zinc-binding protein [Spongisporangium articulatum]|uniref:RRQRL motif-containing zinc-binding protein n=1 Tax=Spongisporangium articulatum TaxID=3362603 RepID=A0ABW8AIR4_9ACTN